MTRLKLGPLVDDKPVRLTIELPAQVHRDLVAYAEALGREEGTEPVEPPRLVAPMLARFMATDRAFAAARRVAPNLLDHPTTPVPGRVSSNKRATGLENA